MELDAPTPPTPTDVVVVVEDDDDIDVVADDDGFSNAAINEVVGLGDDDVGDDIDVDDDNNEDGPTLPPSVVGVVDCDPPNNEVAIFNDSRESGTR
jgi:hypothetical protein